MNKSNLVESSVKVYFTNDYGQFKFLKGNRDINEKIVKRIIDSIKVDGINLLKYKPINVDSNMNILDGQHRFTVCMQLKQPVFFIIEDEIALRSIAKINSNSSNWRIKDYLNSYTDLGLTAYLKVQELHNEFPMSPIVIASLLMYGDSRGNNIQDKFKDGLVEVIFEDEARELLEVLNDFLDHTIRPFSNRFTQAIERLRRGGKYDHALMISKMKQSGLKIDRIDSAKSIIAQMEEIINYRMKDRIRII